MDAKKRIDKILVAVHEKVKEEIGVLLGVEFLLNDARNSLVSKAEFIESLAGKQVVAKIDLAGEIEGKGCLALGIKDAIRLGGTLIMLPDSELDEVVGREEYGGETEDSYGEIANIISGSYTKTFEEMYSKAFRFIRKEQQIMIPAKVEVASDEPIPDQAYYQASCTMKLEGRQLGELHMLMPAIPFGLAGSEAPAAEQSATTRADDAPAENIPAIEMAASAVKTEEPSPQKVPAAETTSKPATGAVAGSGGSSPESTPPPVSKKPVDFEKQKKRIDKLLGLCEQKLGDDLSALLGVEIALSGMTNRLITKEELFFDEVSGKQVVTQMEMVGELQGAGHFLVGLKDAIRLGGILIMLPPAELENVVNDEEFGEDANDAYGEIANIVSGVYTQVFEEQYSKRVRFIKKELQQVVPMKVDVASAEPIADELYYMSSMQLKADGEPLGRVRMVLPAGQFHLDQVQQAAEDGQPEPAEHSAAQAEAAAGQSEPTAEPAGSQPAKSAKFDQAKHRQRVDKLLKQCCKGMTEEVAALLGADIRFTDIENRPISKEDFFFDVANGKQVISHFDVVGELQDRSYLFVSLKDAIHLGGVLIMLPPSEIESVVAGEEFGDDARDAFGEIANIIAGVYARIFEEQYTEKIRFVKNDIGIVSPMKVDVESDEPVVDVEYYLSSMTLVIEGHAKGRVHMLMPAEMLKLDSARAGAAQQAGQVTAATVATPGSGSGAAEADSGQHVPVDILVITDDDQQYSRLAEVAQASGLSVRKISFKDNVKNAITQELKAVYIMMREVNEQGFGMAIKVSSSCSLPLIAAGPDWTRSRVIKAVKYGVNDILLTPASAEDIQESLESNLLKMAA